MGALERCGNKRPGLPGRFSVGLLHPANGRHQSAALAQLVEHIIRNDGVGCSNHPCGTIRIARKFALLMPQWGASQPGTGIPHSHHPVRSIRQQIHPHP